MTDYIPAYEKNSVFLQNNGKPIVLKPIGKDEPQVFKYDMDKFNINDFAKHTNLYQLVVDPQSNDSVINVNANSNATANMSNDPSGIIDIRKLMETSTSKDYKIKIKNNSTDQSITSDGIHARALLGTGGKPFPVWPLILPESESLSISVDDLSGSSNAIRLTFEAFKYYFPIYNYLSDEYKELLRKSSFFVYTTDDDVQLTSSSTDVTNAHLTINSNHDFQLKRITFHSDGAFLIKIAGNSGRNNISNGWVHSSTLGDNGSITSIYSEIMQNIILERTSRIDIQFKNLSGSTNNIYLAFSGIAFFTQKNLR